MKSIQSWILIGLILACNMGCALPPPSGPALPINTSNSNRKYINLSYLKLQDKPTGYQNAEEMASGSIQFSRLYSMGPHSWLGLGFSATGYNMAGYLLAMERLEYIGSNQFIGMNIWGSPSVGVEINNTSKYIETSAGIGLIGLVSVESGDEYVPGPVSKISSPLGYLGLKGFYNALQCQVKAGVIGDSIHFVEFNIGLSYD